MADDPAPPLSVLVVEDHEDGAASLAELLRLFGHRVEIARTGRAALAAAAADPPDVALVDLHLPDMDGWAVARGLRGPAPGRGKRPLLLAVTGCGSADDRERSAAAGFDLHLLKPVEPAELAGLLDRFRRVLAPAGPAPDAEPLLPQSHPRGADMTRPEVVDAGPAAAGDGAARVRVFLADDHPLVRAGLRALVESRPDFEVVGEAADGDGAARDVPAARPDVVVLDVRMPGCGGVGAAGELARTCPGARVLAVSAHEDGGTSARCSRPGRPATC